MRYPAGHKKQTSEKILHAAGRLFRKRGYAATGVDAVMASVDLTAGGFYSHFRCKEDLLAETLDLIFREGQQNRHQQLSRLKGCAWLRAFVTYYLSKEHRDGPDRGCPMPALAAEVARVGGKPSLMFQRHVQSVIDSIAGHFDSESPDRRRAISAMAQCTGGLMLARAVGNSELSEEILESCRQSVMDEIARTEK